GSRRGGRPMKRSKVASWAVVPAILLAPGLARAQGHPHQWSGIVPPDAKVFGKASGDWAAARLMGALQAEAAAGHPSLTIDRRPRGDVEQSRARSDAFSLLLGALYEPFGYAPGPRRPNYADGYWILLAPLPPGEHTIALSAACFDPVYFFDFTVEVTYRLSVTDR